MKRDITRDTFNATRHYSSVRAQQGRVQLDADLNEQVGIRDYRSRTTFTDVIGTCGVPDAAPDSFQIVLNADGSGTIGQGRMYVDGILVENETTCALDEQPELWGENRDPVAAMADIGSAEGYYAIYLDVWEREITPNDDPDILEPALEGIDTTFRTKVSWQVRLHPLGETAPADPVCETAEAVVIAAKLSTGTLEATYEAPSDPDPCLGPSDAGYVGLENVLYRVEIHDPGLRGVATFKWSRHNAAVEAAVTGYNETTGLVELSTLGPDTELGFSEDDIVELTSDFQTLGGLGGPLGSPGEDQWARPGFLGALTDLTSTQATFTEDGGGHPDDDELGLNLRIRKWDGLSTPVAIPTSATPIPLGEDGVSVAFGPGTYRVGEYWLIPARSATGEIQWTPAGLQRPHGPTHHYCVLAIARYQEGDWSLEHDCRDRFPPLTDLPAGAATEVVQLLMAGGDGQRGVPGGELPSALRVAVVDAEGAPVSGAQVRFNVVDGSAGGTLTVAEGTGGSGTSVLVTVSSAGIAAVKFTLANTVEGRVRVVTAQREVASVLTGPVVTFSATFRDQAKLWVEKCDIARSADDWATSLSPQSMMPTFTSGSVGDEAHWPPATPDPGDKWRLTIEVAAEDLDAFASKLVWTRGLSSTDFSASVALFYDDNQGAGGGIYTTVSRVVTQPVAVTPTTSNTPGIVRYAFRFESTLNQLKSGRYTLRLRPALAGQALTTDNVPSRFSTPLLEFSFRVTNTAYGL